MFLLSLPRWREGLEARALEVVALRVAMRALLHRAWSLVRARLSRDGGRVVRLVLSPLVCVEVRARRSLRSLQWQLLRMGRAAHIQISYNCDGQFPLILCILVRSSCVSSLVFEQRALTVEL